VTGDRLHGEEYLLRADSHYASRFRSVTVPSSFRQNGFVFTLYVVFSHLTERHMIGGLRLFPSSMQPTATECVFRLFVNY